jgi:hypothetical protein
LIKYPKIETLWKRDDKFKIIIGDFRNEAFKQVNRWHVTEKIDGMNIRVIYDPKALEDEVVRYAGRTDRAQLPGKLVDHLREKFTHKKLDKAFPNIDCPVVLFGEGYGPKIQKGGNYRPEGQVFRMFDVAVLGSERVWWLKWDDVSGIAESFDVETAPVYGKALTTCQAADLVHEISCVACEEDGNPAYVQEGVIARTDPYLHTRDGGKVMWKLKVKDFA